jgi:hypothetical protein
MATAAQITANQANAQLSTGPRSAAGKARVSRNATRHGLTARHLVIADHEQEEFAALESSLAAELDPRGALEIVTFQELLHAAWNLQRFSRIEAEVSTGTAEDFTNPAITTVLDRLTRYQSRAQRAFYKAQSELRVLQTNRALRARKLTEEEEAETPAIVSVNELTKQTQSEITAKAIDVAVKLTDVQANVFMRDARRQRAAALSPANGL